MKARKWGLERDLEFQEVARRWAFVPARVRRAVVDVVRVFGPDRVTGVFPTPEKAKWKDVEMTLLGTDRVRIRVLGVTETYSYKELGLADKRKPGTPRAEWRMLRTYAENPEPDAYYKLPKRPNLKVDIARFRKWLKTFFRIAGDPLLPFDPNRWLPRFKIGQGV